MFRMTLKMRTCKLWRLVLLFPAVLYNSSCLRIMFCFSNGFVGHHTSNSACCECNLSGQRQDILEQILEGHGVCGLSSRKAPPRRKIKNCKQYFVPFFTSFLTSLQSQIWFEAPSAVMYCSMEAKQAKCGVSCVSCHKMLRH